MTPHKEQPAVDTSAEAALRRARTYIETKGTTTIEGTLVADGDEVIDLIDAALLSLAAHPAEPEVFETNPIVLAQVGYTEWATKPHNAKWARKIDGTPIPNDLPVVIADQFAPILALLRSRAEKAEAALKQPVSDEEVEAIIGRLRRGLLASAGLRPPGSLNLGQKKLNAAHITALRIMTRKGWIDQDAHSTTIARAVDELCTLGLARYAEFGFHAATPAGHLALEKEGGDV